ncbi:hypothetical protein ACFQI7_31520 [Paenibacillus allorhizosphaerae]|uniref:hypothetical protein n=1 Tax=Paenibacillus allorhizosphaerae TaxID=2849866 RepID=UPI003624678D
MSGLSLPEHFIEKYTHLIQYHHWHWYYTCISLCATLWLSRLFYTLFFRIKRSRTDGDFAGQ